MEAKLLEGRAWKSTELKGNHIGRFREFLRDMHIHFETSDAGCGYTHFEVLVSEEESVKANEFLNNLK